MSSRTSSLKRINRNDMALAKDLSHAYFILQFLMFLDLILAVVRFPLPRLTGLNPKE